MNTTTPIPSLNSDSPAICASSFFGALFERRIPITAIGSVGEIKRPEQHAILDAQPQPENPADAPRKAPHDQGGHDNADRCDTGEAGKGYDVLSGESRVPFSKIARHYRSEGLGWVAGR